MVQFLFGFADGLADHIGEIDPEEARADLVGNINILAKILLQASYLKPPGDDQSGTVGSLELVR